MKQKAKTIVFKVNNDIKEKMIKYFNDLKRDKTPPYAIFQAEEAGTVVTLYNSNKVMFQGPNAISDASIWQGNTNFMNDELLDSESTKKETEDNFSIPININSIGSDEVGTGDYFGPIVVTATYVQKENIPFLIDLGVRDSKKLSDEFILKNAKKIINKIPYSTLVLSPIEYNNNYSKDMNMNKIKAILHNKVLCELKNKNYDYDYIVVDQFTPKKNYFNYLKETNNLVSNITFMTKAEDKCISVACASIISRYVFLCEIDKLGNSIDMFLPKGAGSLVDEAAVKIIKKYGAIKLKELAKLNFSNTIRITKVIL